MKDFTVTFVVSSESSEKLRQVRQRIAGRLQPYSLYADVGTANDTVIVKHHRLGDYFNSVQVAESGPTSFRLVFTPRPHADRYWKDLVVKILASIREAGVSIRFEK